MPPAKSADTMQSVLETKVDYISDTIKEIKDTMGKLTSTFVSRTEYDTLREDFQRLRESSVSKDEHAAVTAKVKELESSRNWVVVTVLGTILVAAILAFLKVYGRI